MYRNKNLYGDKIDPVEVRRRIGMVFQNPNPFPKSIYENIAYGARINGHKGNMDDLVEKLASMEYRLKETSAEVEPFGMKLKINSSKVVCLYLEDNSSVYVLPVR